MHHSITRNIGGQDITIETGKMAKQADGAVVLTSGETIVLVTAVSSTELREGQDYFPLTVDYREKASASGRYPGGYFKREGRPSEKDILTSRMIDRPLRPMFPKGYFYDTQIIGLLLSADEVNDPDILCINGASAALAVSDIPFDEPVGAVRVGRVDGQFVANPTFEQREQTDLDLVYVGTENDVIMIEGAGQEVPEDIFVEALKFAHEFAREMIDMQKELAARVNKPKREWTPLLVKDEYLNIIHEVVGSRITEAVTIPGKMDRFKEVKKLKNEAEEKILEQYPDAEPFDISNAFETVEKNAMRDFVLEQGKRADGRGAEDIRPLSAEVAVLPRPHGSSLFSRGETQALCLATLGPVEEAQMIDAYGGGEETKRFILHYNFPPFSVGETGRTGGPGRRETGHGALAERSIEPVLPDESKFPYAIRIVSEVLESNGSTSMASVCGGTLSLMDAGVPISAPVAGISAGLVTKFAEDGSLEKYTMLTDILGMEDHYGDMDFKLCGTRKGVTGFQLDLKLRGISHDLLSQAIFRARDARGVVLDVMEAAMDAPRAQLKDHAPRIETIKIDPDKIGAIIGPGGKTIRGIQAESGADLNVEDDGTVNIYCATGPGLERAMEMIKALTKEIEIGETYHARVVSTKEFGAFVECLPGKEGLVHISELADFRVKKTEDVAKTGDYIWVKCIGIDQKGRIKLSRKAAMDERGEDMGGQDQGGGEGGQDRQQDQRSERGRDHERERDRDRDRNRDQGERFQQAGPDDQETYRPSGGH